MVTCGWGMLLIFGANQATAQVYYPYPPFGLATITVMITAAFLMLLGIYNSAVPRVRRVPDTPKRYSQACVTIKIIRSDRASRSRKRSSKNGK